MQLIAAFSRASNGLTRARGKSLQIDWIQLVATNAMNNRVYGTLLHDNDPILGDGYYQLLRTLGSGMYFVAVAKPESAGIVERCGQTLKLILDLADRDPESCFRRCNIAPAIQFVLAHAARNSAP